MGYSGRSMMAERLSTGVAGLDEVLHGGLLPGQVYLVRGGPAPARRPWPCSSSWRGSGGGSRRLYVTLNESEAELRAGAAAARLGPGRPAILDILPGDEDLSPESQYSIFHPADVELGPDDPQDHRGDGAAEARPGSPSTA